jgi:hypothetical protein
MIEQIPDLKAVESVSHQNSPGERTICRLAIHSLIFMTEQSSPTSVEHDPLRFSSKPHRAPNQLGRNSHKMVPFLELFRTICSVSWMIRVKGISPHSILLKIESRLSFDSNVGRYLKTL